MDGDRRAGGTGCEGASRAADSDLALIVGRNLRRLRTRHGYSLGRLAVASGVSRAMLGQIELGRSTPTIGVLWKIARALDVPFAAFTIGSQAAQTSVVRAADAKILVSHDGAFSSRALFPANGHRRVEFYELRLAPGAREEADPHPAATVENLVVGSGRIEIGLEGTRHRLNSGDAILFEADVPHSYHNPGETEATMYLVITYGDLPADS